MLSVILSANVAAELYSLRNNSWTRDSTQMILSYTLDFPQSLLDIDKIHTVLRRIEPNSCTTLIDEQSNPFNRLQLKDVISRHRGVKPARRYGLLELINLLSLAYLWSDYQNSFHVTVLGHYRRLVVPAWLMGLTVRLGLWVVIMSFFEISDSEPWHAPDTLLEATAPVKLSCCEPVWNHLVCLCDPYSFVKRIKSGISRTHFAPTYPELNVVLQ